MDMEATVAEPQRVVPKVVVTWKVHRETETTEGYYKGSRHWSLDGEFTTEDAARELCIALMKCVTTTGVRIEKVERTEWVEEN